LVDAQFNWRGGRGERLVQLGDFIDRGDSSAGCLDLLRRLKKQAKGAVVVLKGNHEDLLLSQHLSPEDREAWLANGGTSTEASYPGGQAQLIQQGGRDWKWLNRLPAGWICHDVLFAHGGLQADAPDAMEYTELNKKRGMRGGNGKNYISLYH
jgi:hypothetical protein